MKVLNGTFRSLLHQPSLAELGHKMTWTEGHGIAGLYDDPGYRGTCDRCGGAGRITSELCCETVHRCCLAMGVIFCEPSVFPLPTLVRVAARPSADMHLDERLLGMAAELGERPCRSMQDRWQLDSDRRQLCLSLDEPGPAAIGDALFVQRELTGDLLDFHDSYAPGELERRGLRVAGRLGPAALAIRP
jgi:hypothetical protein